MSVRMRPLTLTLAERGLQSPTVSLGALLRGGKPAVAGSTDVTLEDYTGGILSGGFPGMRASTGRAQRAMLDGYLERIIDRDFPETGRAVRDPA
ncbi:MAG TPA: AAA family ATPase, partial [Actinomycetes bacterium]